MTGSDGMDEIIQIRNRSASLDGLTDGQEDISQGVETSVGNVDAVTIFLDVAGAVNVTVEFSPDGGTNWYEPRGESPVEFSSSDTDLVHVVYNADRIRLTGSNTTGVNAQLREVV